MKELMVRLQQNKEPQVIGFNDWFVDDVLRMS